MLSSSPSVQSVCPSNASGSGTASSSGSSGARRHIPVAVPVIRGGPEAVSAGVYLLMAPLHKAPVHNDKCLDGISQRHIHYVSDELRERGKPKATTSSMCYVEKKLPNGKDAWVVGP